MERHKLIDALDSLDEIRQVIIEALKETHDPAIQTSSHEVAEITGKCHKDVLKNIRAMFIAQQDIEAGAYVRSYAWNNLSLIHISEPTRPY